MYCGFMPGMKSGDVVGHEFMGIVEDVGPEVSNFKKGKHLSWLLVFLGKGFCFVNQLDPSILNILMFVQVIAWLLLV